MSVTAMLPPAPHIVVFGRDQSGKPHASWFDQASGELATKAAALMNMRAVPVETEAVRELVGTLPRGRVFSSGRAFTPFVKGQLYTRLIELLGLSQADAEEAQASANRPKAAKGADAGQGASSSEAAASSGQAGGDGPSSRPTRADDIGLGSIVLATTGPAEGWFEAEVIGLNGTMLTLKYCDYVEPTVVRRRHEVGFLPAVQG